MAQKKKILLLEDEQEVASLIKLQAELCGYKIHVEVDGINGYYAIERERPDLVILDILLPGIHGLDVCRKLKNHPELRHIPVIIISGKKEEIDQVLGLELGADDYVTKPFSLKVLFSRVKAVLRRNTSMEKINKEVSFGDFVLEVDRYLLRKNEDVISLTLSEFGILRRLLNNRGKVLSRHQLLDDVNNDDSFIVDRNIDVHIASLRKKISDSPPWIETVRGVGYRFKEKG